MVTGRTTSLKRKWKVHLVGPSSTVDPAQNYPGSRPDAVHGVYFSLCCWQTGPQPQQACTAAPLLHPSPGMFSQCSQYL